MLKLPIKLTHQISAVIDCSSSIIVHIFMIEKNSNCLPSSSTLLHFNQCRRNHICSRFHKLIICSAIRTEFFMPLFMIAITIFFLRVPHICSLRTSPPAISLTSCIISAALASVFNPATERRNLKASLALIQVKREVSKGGKFRSKSLLPARYC